MHLKVIAIQITFFYQQFQASGQTITWKAKQYLNLQTD